ncbi:MAG: bile acid:sodium symporter [Planctomycetota bacterium]|nr:bile acid:sodium symporter [Planctomycetota bacterium]MCX8039581.1 bile acid:sodium symporter [Planctomycetota bacterium]MDW8373128.1 bile acid:sodium symporter [Planctomycetota bacterium]
MSEFLRRHWFLVAYALVVALALGFPQAIARGGSLHLELWTPWCIAAIFFVSGLALSPAVLREAAVDWRAHLLVQGICFAGGAALGWLLVRLAAPLGLPADLGAGLLLVACLPTTIAGCVVITALAGGNRAIAAIGAVVGNALGLLVTPLLAHALLAIEAELSLPAVIGKLALITLLPLLLGQALRQLAPAACEARRHCFSVVNGVLLLSILGSVFADLALAGRSAGLLAALPLCLALFSLLFALGWSLPALLAMPRRDRIAIAITASQKTVTLGVPLAHALGADGPAVLLPLALYHAVQIVGGSLLAGRLHSTAEGA